MATAEPATTPRTSSAREWTRITLTVLAASTILIAVSAIVPVTTSNQANPVAVALISLVLMVIVLVVVIRWLMSRVRRSKRPLGTLIEALAIVFVLFLTDFSRLYYFLSVTYSGSFSQELDFLNAFYYAMTVFSTVGFGDITPVTSIAKIITMVQMALNIVLLGVGVRVLTRAAKQASAPQPATT